MPAILPKMDTYKDRVMSIWLVLNLLLPLIVWLGCTPSKENESAKATAVQNEAFDARQNSVIEELEVRWKATSRWQDDLKFVPVWTIDVRKVLIREDGRPIVAAGILYDVEFNDRGYLLHFKPDIRSQFGMQPQIEFKLLCDLPPERRKAGTTPSARLGASILTKYALRPEYVFAAQIKKVERIEKLVPRKEGGEDLVIEVEHISNFEATGTCLELKTLQEDSGKQDSR